jgi:hypothetical protein
MSFLLEESMTWICAGANGLQPINEMGGGGAEVQHLAVSGILLPRQNQRFSISSESFIAFVSFIRRNGNCPMAC